jgi:hypothetical protein
MGDLLLREALRRLSDQSSLLKALEEGLLKFTAKQSAAKAGGKIAADSAGKIAGQVAAKTSTEAAKKGSSQVFKVGSR